MTQSRPLRTEKLRRRNAIFDSYAVIPNARVARSLQGENEHAYYIVTVFACSDSLGIIHLGKDGSRVNQGLWSPLGAYQKWEMDNLTTSACVIPTPK